MWQTWIDFCKSMDSDQSAIPFEHSEWFSWMDYASRNYQEPFAMAAPPQDWNER